MSTQTVKIVTLTFEEVERLTRIAYDAGKVAGQLPAKAWTLKECAAFLDVSEETLSTMAQNRQIPCQKIGQKPYRFHPQAVADWLAKQGDGY